MTQIVLDRVTDSRSQDAASAPVSRGAATRSLDRSTPEPVRQQRPARGSGRAPGPILRPVVACPPPATGRVAARRTQACSVPAFESAAPGISMSSAPSWRLTDRGVAVVLVVALMIMVAALTVVGLTAVKVTGAGYQATVSASMPR